MKSSSRVVKRFTEALSRLNPLQPLTRDQKNAIKYFADQFVNTNTRNDSKPAPTPETPVASELSK